MQRGAAPLATAGYTLSREGCCTAGFDGRAQGYQGNRAAFPAGTSGAGWLVGWRPADPCWRAGPPDRRPSATISMCTGRSWRPRPRALTTPGTRHGASGVPCGVAGAWDGMAPPRGGSRGREARAAHRVLLGHADAAGAWAWCVIDTAMTACSCPNGATGWMPPLARRPTPWR